jgi:hypothetical protein
MSAPAKANKCLDHAIVRRVLQEIQDERQRQHEKWGEQNHPDGTGGEPGRDVAPSRVEELRAIRKQYAEDAKELCDAAFREGRGTWRHILREEIEEAIAEDDAERLRKELIQTAAVAVAWVEAIDRRRQ